jgi:RND family efflux transporter MFP subunit
MLATGIIASKNEMPLAFKVGGIIKRITVNEGVVVKRGQLLAELEPAEIDSQLVQAQQLADKAQRERERGERLYKDQVIALEQLEALRTQADIAQAQLKAVQFNRGFAAIHATADGIVLRKLADEHEIVAAGQPVLALSEREGGYVVKAGLADREVVQLKLGDIAEIHLDAMPAQTFKGQVSEISRAANSQSSLFPIEVRLENAPRNLSSGMVAQLRITPSTAGGTQLVYVPIGAIVEGDAQRAWVFTIRDQRAHRQAVEVAFIDGDRVALRSGVAAGTQVITDGVLYLSEGEAVSVVAQDAQQEVEKAHGPA